jgi:hypothetical protein
LHTTGISKQLSQRKKKPFLEVCKRVHNFMHQVGHRDTMNFQLLTAIPAKFTISFSAAVFAFHKQSIADG